MSTSRAIADLPRDADAGAHGFDAKVKRAGLNDLFLTPLHAAIPKATGVQNALVYDIPAQIVVAMMDAARATPDGGVLFSEATFGISR